MDDQIECLDCGYIGIPGKDDGDAIWYCPECESMYIIVLMEVEHEQGDN